MTIHRSLNVRKALLAVDLPRKWTREHSAKKNAAIASGYSSVRISRATLEKLRSLAMALAKLHSGDEDFRYYYDRIPLTELLDHLSDAIVIKPDRDLVRACTRAIARKHAKDDRKKHAPPAPTSAVHAAGAR